jgi:RNA polymerase sigma factor (sigma-70 family)
MTERVQALGDDEIVQLLQGNDADRAIRFLYRAHYEFLERYILNNKGSHEDAQDIFQETIVAFINVVKSGKFRGESSIKTFLYSLNRNIWLNELKRRGRALAREVKYEKEGGREEDAVYQALETREAGKELMKVMEALGENCRKILLLYYYENRPMKEILASLPYENEQVVRNKKYKCLKQLEGLIAGNENLYQQLKNQFNG